MIKMNKLKDKMTLHPIMTFIILIAATIVISGFLSLIGVEATYNRVNPQTGELISTLVSVESLFSLSGLKYIFTSTVSNFAAFTPLSMLLIILLGIGVMEKSGFLKTAFTLLTKVCKKNTITFCLVFVAVVSSIGGDLGYIVLIPLAALLFKYGRRNPILGIIAAFAGLTCGSGISIMLTAIDSALMTSTLNSAAVIDINYSLGVFSYLFIMIIATVLVSFVVTLITEKIVAEKIGKYDFKEEEEEFEVGKKEIRGLVFGIGAAILYLLFIIYQIIPNLPFSGKFLDNSSSANFYIDKLFSVDSFFSNGFIFIVLLLFVILGLFYGFGAKTIKNNKEFAEDLGHSLDEIGKIIVLIFFASVFINVFKKTEIGTVLTAVLATSINTLNFSGIPLIILLFIISAITTFFLPSPVAKWAILSGTAVPVLMSVNISPEFAQVVFRFGESMTMGITPVLAYFVIYLAYIDKYNDTEKPIALFQTIKYQMPYTFAVGGVLLLLLILWYLIGIPIGLGGIAII